MTYADRTFMGPDSHTSQVGRPRERLKLYLRRQYHGAHRAKALSQDIECTPKAAENILDGHWPNDLHLAAIVRRFGRDVWEAVFEPEIDPVLARLSQEERQLEEALAKAQARRRQAEGRAQSAAQRLASTEARTLRRPG